RLSFRKRLTSDLALSLCFDNDRLGSVGRGFTLLLGVEGTGGPLGGLVWRDSFFRVFGADALQPCWTYSSLHDLKASLRGLAALLHEVLPTFEPACRLYLDRQPRLDALPESISRRGPITAREGWLEAVAMARTWSPRVGLIRVTSHCDVKAREALGPGLGL